MENGTILIAESNEELRQYISNNLSSLFYLLEAKNGKEAFEIFQNSRLDEYDVIIMDVMMPVMDGLEATKAIRMLEREDAKKIPIIAMTANAFSEDKQTAISVGMNGHVAKPIDINVLLPMILKYIK